MSTGILWQLILMHSWPFPIFQPYFLPRMTSIFCFLAKNTYQTQIKFLKTWSLIKEAINLNNPKNSSISNLMVSDSEFIVHCFSDFFTSMPAKMFWISTLSILLIFLTLLVFFLHQMKQLILLSLVSLTHCLLLRK